MAIINGSNMILYVEGDGAVGSVGVMYPIACDTQCDFEIKVQTIDTSVKDNGYYSSVVAALVSVSLSGTGLVDFSQIMGVAGLQTKILSRATVSYKFTVNVSDTLNVIYSGLGILTDLKITGAVKNAAIFAYMIAGSGAPSVANNIPAGGGVIPQDVTQPYSLSFTATAGQTSYTDSSLIGATILAFFFSGLNIYIGPGSNQFNSTTGTLSWSFSAQSGAQGLVLYKK